MGITSRLVHFVCPIATAMAIILVAPHHVASEEPALSDLLDTLANGEPKAKVEAARSLSNNPRYPEQVIPLLIASLEDERPEQEVPFGIPAPPWRVADQAESALVSFDAAAVPGVTQLLGHSQAKVRTRAARVLSQIGEAAKSSAPRIAEAIRDETDTDARSALLNAIGTVADDSFKLAHVLLVAMESDSPDYCALAIRICGRRGLQDGAIIQRVRAGLDDTRSRWGSWSPDTAFPVPVRRDAAEALGRIGPAARAAEPRLRHMMQSDGDLETQIAAAYAVFRIMEEDAAAMDFLIKVAGQPGDSPAAAPMAVRFLGELGPKAKSAFPVLVRSCTYESEEQLGFDAELRHEALAAVAAVGGVDSIPVLRNALKSADALDRQTAAELIPTLGREALTAVPELVCAVEDERDALSGFARGAAIEALGKLGADAKAAIPVLEKVAAASDESEDAWLVDIAKNSLAKIKGREVPLRRKGADE